MVVTRDLHYLKSIRLLLLEASNSLIRVYTMPPEGARTKPRAPSLICRISSLATASYHIMLDTGDNLETTDFLRRGSVSDESSPSPIGSSPSSIVSVSRGRTSPIWRYCRVEPGKLLHPAWIDSSGTKWWHCQPCFDKKRDKRYNYSGGSSTILHHLRREHSIAISGKEEARKGRTENRLGDITAFLAREVMQSSKKRKYTADAVAIDQATVLELYCRFTVRLQPSICTH